MKQKFGRRVNEKVRRKEGRRKYYEEALGRGRREGEMKELQGGCEGKVKERVQKREKGRKIHIVHERKGEDGGEVKEGKELGKRGREGGREEGTAPCIQR